MGGLSKLKRMSQQAHTHGVAGGNRRRSGNPAHMRRKSVQTERTTQTRDAMRRQGRERASAGAYARRGRRHLPRRQPRRCRKQRPCRSRKGRPRLRERRPRRSRWGRPFRHRARRRPRRRRERRHRWERPSRSAPTATPTPRTTAPPSALKGEEPAVCAAVSEGRDGSSASAGPMWHDGKKGRDDERASST
jgi:hypothetical protein